MSTDDLALNPHVRESAPALLGAILQATDYGILLTGLDRQDIIANRRLGEMFDLTPQQIVEMEPGEVRAVARTRFRDPEAFEALLNEIYADPTLAREDELELAGEPRRVVRRYTAPVCDPSGSPIGRLWTFLDITDTKRLEAEKQAQLAARTADFLATSETLRTMNDLCRLAAQGQTREEALTQAVGLLARLLGPVGVAVLLQDEETACWRGLAAAPGKSSETLELPAVPGTRALEYGDCFAARSSGRGEAIAALQSGPPSSESLALWLGVPRVTCLPLQGAEGPFGLVVLGEGGSEEEADPRKAARVCAVVDQVALTLEAHRLQSELQAALSALQAAQRQMVEMERLRVAGILASHVAQDIRNILTPVQVELATGPEGIAEAVQDQLNRFFALTHQLLAFSKPGVLETGPTSLAEVLRRIVPLVERQAKVSNVSIGVNVPESLPPAAADAGQLEHLFVNLCLNGIRSMAGRGGKLTVTGSAMNGWIEVRVEDTGAGIAPQDLARVFEPFYSQRANGLGLGLFSCKRIVEEHGGELAVTSAPGEGACFTVRLPLAWEG